MGMQGTEVGRQTRDGEVDLIWALGHLEKASTLSAQSIRPLIDIRGSPRRRFPNHWDTLVTKVLELSPLEDHQRKKSTQITMTLRIFQGQSQKAPSMASRRLAHHLSFRPFALA